MKVLVVTNMYPTRKNPFFGIFVKQQVESLQKEGVNIDVVFIKGRENRLNYFTCIKELFKMITSINYDLIHAHHTYCIYPIMIVKALARIRTPVILTFHEGEVHKTNELRKKDIDCIKRLVFSKKIKKFALRMVDVVISVQQELIEALNFEGQYRIIPCGINLDLFQPMERESCRKKLKLPLNKKIIFFPAAPGNENKGFHILSEALKKLGREDIHPIAAGNIDYLDMPIYMGAADVVVQLSEFEASPMVLKEAMAVNVPVIFTDVGDVRYIAGNVKGCYLCRRTPQDVALRLEEAFKCNGNSEGRNRIIETGLGLPEIAKRIIEVFEDTIHAN